jgi:hypothetical protein
VLFGGGLVGLVSLGLLVYCLFDVLTTPSSAIRTLPKPLWLFVVLPPVFGPAAWFLAGRPRAGSATRQLPTVLPPEPTGPVRAPDDDPDFLRELQRRADEQRRRARDPRDDDRER